MATELEPTIQAALAAALRKVRVPETRWATVEDYEPLSEQTQLTVDGDSDPTSATNATGTGLAAGQRVLVLHSPPSAAHVIGHRPAPPIEYEATLDNVDVGAGSIYGEYVFTESGLIHFAVVAELGTGFAITGSIGVSLPVTGSLISEHTPWLTVARATIGAGSWVGAAPYQPLVSTELVSPFRDGGGGNWDASTPAAWDVGDVLRITGVYPRRLPLEDNDAE